MADVPTHAIVVRVTFKAGLEEVATKLLETEVVPGARQADGFVAGYWMHSDDHRRGTSVELFDSLANAEAELGRRSTEMPPESPVSIESVEILEIVVRA
ncbi:MAG TPA: hypothetical protein VMF60_08370 [Acidimicrobiales bacterium]|nr:hypothetical protein [Acidimicrobiales bacterium]